MIRTALRKAYNRQSLERSLNLEEEFVSNLRKRDDISGVYAGKQDF